MFQSIYLKKWTDNFSSVEIIEIAIEQWKKGLTGLSDISIEKAIDHCRVNLFWPPSIAEFVSFCEKYDGLITADEVMQAAIRRDFKNEITSLVFNRIGSYSFSNDSEINLRKKVLSVYEEVLSEIRIKRSTEEIRKIENEQE